MAQRNQPTLSTSELKSCFPQEIGQPGDDYFQHLRSGFCVIIKKASNLHSCVVHCGWGYNKDKHEYGGQV